MNDNLRFFTVQFLEYHEEIRKMMKMIKFYKAKKKSIERVLINIFNEMNTSVVNFGDKRIYYLKNQGCLTVYHPRNS